MDYINRCKPWISSPRKFIGKTWYVLDNILKKNYRYSDEHMKTTVQTSYKTRSAFSEYEKRHRDHKILRKFHSFLKIPEVKRATSLIRHGKNPKTLKFLSAGKKRYTIVVENLYEEYKEKLHNIDLDLFKLLFWDIGIRSRTVLNYYNETKRLKHEYLKLLEKDKQLIQENRDWYYEALEDYKNEISYKKDLYEYNEKMKTYNDKVSYYAEKEQEIQQLEFWDDFVEIETENGRVEKYGLKHVVNNIHRENDCMGVIITARGLEYTAECGRCRSMWGAGCGGSCSTTYETDVQKCEKCGKEVSRMR